MVSGRLRTSGGVMREEYNLTIMDLNEGWTYTKQGGYTLIYSKGLVFKQSDRFRQAKPILAYKKLYAYRMDSGQVIWRTALQEGMDRIHNFDIEVGK